MAPASRHAPAVQALLDAGARLVGKTITEELAFSAVGTNPHYGTPKNVAAPGRVPGGSSSGSASAVGGGLVDLALGSDTGGSVRVPASYNGILGMRPSHGRISLAGVMPLAPSFDTVGWFARDPQLFATAGRVLLGDRSPGRRQRACCWRRTPSRAPRARSQERLRPAIRAVEERLGAARPVTVSADGLDAWHEVFRILQGAEAWAEHGAWIESARPRIGPFLVERLRLACDADRGDEVAAAAAARAAIRAALDRLLADGALLLLPSAPGPATAGRCRDGRARAGARAHDRHHLHRLARRPAPGQPAARPRWPRGRSACRCSPAAARTRCCSTWSRPARRVATNRRWLRPRRPRL